MEEIVFSSHKSLESFLNAVMLSLITALFCVFQSWVSKLTRHKNHLNLMV